MPTRPPLFDSRKLFKEANYSRLRSLYGQRLLKTWFLWHSEFCEWWVDGPVLLQFEQDQLEFEGSHCMVGVSWDTIDLAKVWRESLQWVEQVPELDLSGCLGKKLVDIDLIGSPLTDELIGISLHLESKSLNLYDAGDETGLWVGHQLMPNKERFPLRITLWEGLVHALLHSLVSCDEEHLRRFAHIPIAQTLSEECAFNVSISLEEMDSLATCLEPNETLLRTLIHSRAAVKKDAEFLLKDYPFKQQLQSVDVEPPFVELTPTMSHTEYIAYRRRLES